MRKEWIVIVIGTITALVLAVGGTWMFAQTSEAEAAEVIQPATNDSEIVAPQDLAPASQLIMEETIQRAAQARPRVATNQGFAVPRGNRGDPAS